MSKRSKFNIFLIIITAAVALCSCYFRTPLPVPDIAGAFTAVVSFFVLSKVIRITDGLYYSTMIFIFFATSVGSVMDLYSIWTPYDKIIHFMSGILLAVYGMVMFERLMINASQETDLHIYRAPVLFSSFLFSAAAAGLWEIFEFAADMLFSGEMQRGMLDTITDMIAGDLGALCCVLFMAKKMRK